MLVVWHDDPCAIIARAAEIEHELLKVVWECQSYDKLEFSSAQDKGQAIIAVEELSSSDTSSDIEANVTRPTNTRSTTLIAPILTSATVILSLAVTGRGWRVLAREVAWDGDYMRLALIAVTPFAWWLSWVCNLSDSGISH